MPLNDEQRQQLKELQRLEKEPAKPEPNVSYNIDLGNPDAVSLGRKLGIIPKDEEETTDDDDSSDDDEDQQQPRRRSSGADRWAGR